MRSPFRLICAVLLLLALLPMTSQAQGSGLEVRIVDFKNNFPDMQVDFRVIDPVTRRDVAGLTDRNLVLLQDGAELKNAGANLTAVSTGPNAASMPFGQAELKSSGATIAVVADLSTLLNVPGDPTDYNSKVREIVHWWLEAGRNVAPQDPEQISLFVPATRAGNESLQPEVLHTLPSGFTYDRNLVLVTLDQHQPRQGATFLYDAILAATNATGQHAAERGTDAYVLVISDGGADPISQDQLSAINASTGGGRTVKLITVGIGSPTSLEANGIKLKTLADATGGTYLPAPTQEQVQQTYASLVKPTERTGYTLKFKSDLIQDRNRHTLVVRVNVDGRQGEGQLLEFVPATKSSTLVIQDVAPIRDVLRNYLMRAVPAIVLLAAVLAGIVSGLQKRRYSGAPGQTRT